MIKEKEIKKNCHINQLTLWDFSFSGNDIRELVPEQQTQDNALLPFRERVESESEQRHSPARPGRPDNGYTHTR